MKSVVIPHIETFKRNGRTWARLLQNYAYQTPITGHHKTLNGFISAILSADGLLKIERMSEWDLGTGAVDTPAMVYASLPHDIFCEMTSKGMLPWSVRHQADKYFWQCLTGAGATISRFWRTPLVMLNSQLVARWGRKK